MTRQERIELIAEVIAKCEGVTTHKITAQFAYRFGVSERKIREYLDLLERNGKIKIDEDLRIFKI